MLYEFRQGKKATESTATMCSVYGCTECQSLPGVVCQVPEQQFRSGGRTAVKNLLDENPSQFIQELAETLHFDQSTLARQLHEMGKIQKASRWVPHKLSAKNMEDHKSTCATLLETQR